MNKRLIEIPEAIETRRLIIRQYRPGDGKMYFAVGQKNRDHLLRFEAMNAVLGPTNEEEAEVVIRQLIHEWAGRDALFLGGFQKITKAFIVQIYLGIRNWDTGDFELGYFVDCDYEGQGYVSEASRAVLDLVFTQLGGRRVQLECSDENIASIRVAERLGFIREGHLRENHLEPDGTFSSGLVFGLLRTDWEKAREKK